MKRIAILVFAVLVVTLANARAQPNERQPYVGYVYPAGAERGTTVTVLLGGQYLRGVMGAYLSGPGVKATSVHYLGPIGYLSNDQLRKLRIEIREAYRARIRAGRRRPARRRAKPKAAKTAKKTKGAGKATGKGKKAGKKAQSEKEVILPDLPLLRDIEKRTPRELKKISDTFLDPVHRQRFNRQIAERVEVEFTLAPDAPPGARELRLETPLGLTNPIRFEVGTLPEVSEKEINDFTPEELPAPAPAFVLNGQAGYRDIDRFRFPAKKGQMLVIDAGARRLVPYLADAVPGWFQAVLSLRNPEGKEVAFDDDYRFDPDPVLFYKVPADGQYELRIRDAIYRGRHDFVYRVTVGEVPFVTRMFPLGGQTGAKVTAELGGVNLAVNQVSLNTRPGPRRFREVASNDGSPLVRPIPYEVDALPEIVEKEPNDSLATAQSVTLPHVVDGRIGKVGDVDCFRIEGKKGQEVVAEVEGRRLASPIDSLVRIRDASGKILAWNDDFEDPCFGLVTDQADSYLEYRLPADGTYCVEVSDVQHHGGPEFAYRLRISEPRPDFDVLMTPSALNVPAGDAIPATVHVVRRDGYSGPIDLALRGAPPGVVLSGGRIPAGVDEVRVTLSAPPRPTKAPIPLTIEASARIEGRGVVSHRVVAADQRMQAFIYWHMVPAKELLMAVTRPRARLGALVATGRGPVRLEAGGTSKVVLRLPGRRSGASVLPVGRSLSFDLASAPAGVKIRSVGLDPTGLTLWLSADSKAAKPGKTTNLLVEVYLVYRPPARKANGRKARMATRRIYLGVLPAIPVVVTAAPAKR